MDWKLEVVPIPVSDVDRAKRYYSEQIGFVVDLDTRIGDGCQALRSADSRTVRVRTGRSDRDPWGNTSKVQRRKGGLT